MLLAAVDPVSVKPGIDTWSKIGRESFQLWRLDASLEGNTVQRAGERERLEEPDIDPFREVFFAGLA